MTTASTAWVNWTRLQILAALHVYLELPFGQLHQRNPKIKQLALWIGRTPGSVALKLVNLASLDPVIVASGRSGMGNASALDKQIWAELQTNWDAVALDAAAEYERLASRNGLVSGCIDARKYGGVVQADAKAWGLWGPMLIQRG